MPVTEERPGRSSTVTSATAFPGTIPDHRSAGTPTTPILPSIAVEEEAGPGRCCRAGSGRAEAAEVSAAGAEHRTAAEEAHPIAEAEARRGAEGAIESIRDIRKVVISN